MKMDIDDLTCKRKVTYESKKIAKAMVKKYKANGKDFESYKCNCCNLWHLARKQPASYKMFFRERSRNILATNNNDA